MDKVVGIRFKSSGKIYDFNCGLFVLQIDDKVIVETEQGICLGTVVTHPTLIESRVSKKPLKKVFRIANENDFIQKEKNIQTEKDGHQLCLDYIEELQLSMNLFSVESTFDGNKLTFFFTADGRIDFRQLVKMLVKKFHTRIEMRQVGIRNQAKMCGGVGRCGREICCSSFLGNFEPISIRMAKNQGLSLNPTKISGLCGRLMCCLTYEDETYKILKSKIPKIGRIITTQDGKGRVIRQNTLKSMITLKMENGTEIEIKMDDLRNKENNTHEYRE